MTERRMGQVGDYIGLLDKHGIPIHIGQVIRIYENPQHHIIGDHVPVQDEARVWYMAPEVVAKSLTKEGSYSLFEWGHGEQVFEFEVIENHEAEVLHD